MNFTKIKGIQEGFLETIEGTEAWYSCKLCKNSYDFCDLYEAEEIIKMGNKYEGMNCALIHFPDGEVYYPFQLKENVYVESPVYWDGKLYFLVVDFNKKMIEIVSFDEKYHEKNIVTQIALSEIEDCYNLLLRVAPITLVQDRNDDILNIIWPEKKTITLREHESMYFRDGDKLYCNEWYENPDYHERIIIRDWNSGEIIECFEGNMVRMSNGDIWVL